MPAYLKRLQKMQYDALAALLSFAEENDIRVYLRGGSVLGAVKYHGFVPWDDDIDVAIPRDDYEKLIRVMPERLQDRYLFVAYQRTPHAHCYFPRVILDRKACREADLPMNNERGTVLIDVLPLDGMPRTKAERVIHVIHAYILRILASLWTLEVKETVSMHRRYDRFLNFLRFLGIHRLYRQDDIYRKMDRLYTKYPFGQTPYAGMIAASKREKEIVPYDWWGDGKQAIFGDLRVLVPSNSDAYLRRLFGKEYMHETPPPERRTKSHQRQPA
ncbi:MAG: LicD family protein [Lachnospiraceae bacterium]|nr:LicD family protein [Lachnospiraceae bacterium]